MLLGLGLGFGVSLESITCAGGCHIIIVFIHLLWLFVSRPQMIFYYPFERYTTSWLVWGHQVWMWSGSGNFVLGYDAILWPFYSCKILDSKCMYWSIVSIWCVGLSSKCLHLSQVGSLLYSIHLRPPKKYALIAILVFILLSDINQDSFVVCIVLLHCTLCSRIIFLWMSCIWKRQI
jgi:hypothetical protein